MLEPITSLAIIISIVIVFLAYNITSTKNAPPGPTGLPIVGHLPFLGSNPSITFMKWKNIYGPIVSLRFGSIPTVILNDVNIIKEAFKQDVFSGRPTTANSALIAQFKGIIMNDGPRQVEQRSFAIKSFKDLGVGSSKLEFCIQDEISLFLNNLKRKFSTDKENTKIKIKQFFRLPVINSFWVVIMGHRFEEDDPIIDHFLKLVEA